MAEPDEISEYERGKQAGRTEQILSEHSTHLAHINGSVDKTATALAALANEFAEMRTDMRVRDERAKAAAETLAVQTENRRDALATVQTRRARRLTFVVGAAGVLVAAVCVIANVLTG